MTTRILLVMIFSIGLSACSPNKPGEPAESPEQSPGLQQQVNDLQEQVAVADLQMQIISVQRQIDGLRKNSKSEITPVKKQPDVAPPEPAKKDTCGNLLVNVLLVDDYGRASDDYKGVRLADITRNGKQTRFTFDGGGLVEWYKKVLLGHPYATNESPITGTIYNTPRISGLAGKVANIAPRDVYEDTSTGEIWYDDGAGKCIPAPKGAAYTTTQIIFPDQQ